MIPPKISTFTAI